MNNDEKGIYLEKMITNVLETKFENIPQATIDHTKNRIGCRVQQLVVCGVDISCLP